MLARKLEFVSSDKSAAWKVWVAVFLLSVGLLATVFAFATYPAVAGTASAQSHGDNMIVRPCGGKYEIEGTLSPCFVHSKGRLGDPTGGLNCPGDQDVCGMEEARY